MSSTRTHSPVLKFSSGPGSELGVSGSANLAGQSVKALSQENAKPPDVHTNDSVFSATAYDSEDNASVVSEISTCSSAVTLETVDEAERAAAAASGNRRRASSFRSSTAQSDKAKTPSLSDSGINCPSSSDAEDAEDGRRLSSSRKTSDSAVSGADGTVSAGQTAEGADKQQPDATVVKKRRPSISRRISPALSAIFSSGGGSVKTESGPGRTEKEPKKSGAQVRLRKLSLTTMFHSKPAAEKEAKKRRNTDPSLAAAQEAIANARKQEHEDSPEPNADARQADGLNKSELQLMEVFLKEEDLKIRDLIEHVLRAHLLSMSDYRRTACDRAGRSISKVLKALVTSMKEAADEQCKVVCQVFIGAVKEEGILIATQAFWNSNNDNFAAASFRNEAVFGLGVVISTQIID